MKKYSLIYILLVTLFFTSCNDFLKETNYSGLSDEPFYDSEVGIEALVNSCYTPSRLWYSKEGGTSFAGCFWCLLLLAFGGNLGRDTFDYYSFRRGTD